MLFFKLLRALGLMLGWKSYISMGSLLWRLLFERNSGIFHCQETKRVIFWDLVTLFASTWYCTSKFFSSLKILGAVDCFLYSYSVDYECFCWSSILVWFPLSGNFYLCHGAYIVAVYRKTKLLVDLQNFFLFKCWFFSL